MGLNMFDLGNLTREELLHKVVVLQAQLEAGKIAGTLEIPALIADRQLEDKIEHLTQTLVRRDAELAKLKDYIALSDPGIERLSKDHHALRQHWWTKLGIWLGAVKP